MEDKLKNLLKNLKANESTISMLLGGMVMLVIAILLLNYYRSTPRPQITDESTSTEAAQLSNDIDQIETANLETSVNDLNLEFDASTGKVISPITKVVAKKGEHIVKRGEHLWSIAESYYGSGYNWTDIANENNLEAPHSIEIGQLLQIPDTEPKQPTRLANKYTDKGSLVTISSDKYTVQKGDSLWSISLRAYSDGYKWVEIWNANRQLVPLANFIEVGQVLVIPR